MAITSRIDLKSRFNTGAVPSQKDFCDLIDSVLNKRDDRFFGYWKSGISYQPGDVVLYNKSLYMLTLKEAVEKLPEVAKQEPPKTEKEAASKDDEDCEDKTPEEIKAICSTKNPEEDDRWCMLELDIEDGDWKTLGNKPGDTMYAMVYGKIGMGTENPQGRVDMTEEGKGQFVFNPSDSDIPSPSVRLSSLPKHKDGTGRYISNNINSDYAEWMTNVPIGYVFRKKIQDNTTYRGIEKKEFVSETKDTLDLMLITSNGESSVVGINTMFPEAMLDMKEVDRQLLLNPSKGELPEVIWLNLSANPKYLSAKVDNRNAVFTTNAVSGYRFKIGEDYDHYCDMEKKELDNTVLAITKDGKVGVGTENPKSNLHVYGNKSGEIRLNVDNDNPTVSIINLRPEKMHNYLALGANNDSAVFVTDAINGFVFKKGGNAENGNGNEENIIQRGNIVNIHPDGKIGIGINPVDYDLDVYGKVRANSLHLNTSGKKIIKRGDLENVLPILLKLKPIRFEWDKNNTNCGDEGDQIGFDAEQVEDQFPELVKTQGGAEPIKSLAYQNMVAVLVQGMKEQQILIENLTTKVAELENKEMRK